ncbi:MAG: hypothetical protein ACO3SP_10200 [Ilumatobacteraceae bacterium]
MTAASAIGTGIVIGSVEDVRGVSSDTFLIQESLCNGLYDVTWTFASDGSGAVVGATVSRTTPDNPDVTLQYCANAPVSIMLYDDAVGVGQLVAEALGTTDAAGEVVFTQLLDPLGNPVTPLVAGGWGVRLTIGDMALVL